MRAYISSYFGNKKPFGYPRTFRTLYRALAIGSPGEGKIQIGNQSTPTARNVCDICCRWRQGRRRSGTHESFSCNVCTACSAGTSSLQAVGRIYGAPVPHHAQERPSRHVPLAPVAIAPDAEPTNKGPSNRTSAKGMEMATRSPASCTAVAIRAELVVPAPRNGTAAKCAPANILHGFGPRFRGPCRLAFPLVLQAKFVGGEMSLGPSRKGSELSRSHQAEHPPGTMNP